MSTRQAPPSGGAVMMVARSSSLSQQTLQLEPTLTSSEPSGATATVRVECWPLGTYSRMTSRLDLPELVIERHAEERAAAGHQQRAIVREGHGVGHVVVGADHDLLVGSSVAVAVWQRHHPVLPGFGHEQRAVGGHGHEARVPEA